MASKLNKSAMDILASSKPDKKTRVSVKLVDTIGSTGRQDLRKSILNVLDGPDDSIERLAFGTDPSRTNSYQSVYRIKQRLLPNDLLKRISIQDDLVASILNARGNHISAFGRPQPDRFSTGYKISPLPGHLETLDDKQKKELLERIKQAELKLWTCGETRGYGDHEALNFGQFLFVTTKNALTFGQIAVESIYRDDYSGEKKFHSFRPIDAGTIYRATNQKSSIESVRRQAKAFLEQVHGERFDRERFQNDEYAWVQVVESRPIQAFSPDECLVHNFYPSADVELDGYPVTPLDTVIAAVTTHINITNHNKLYFQSGRAARGMIVIKSDDVDEGTIAHVRQQFMASINNVSNSHRMPIFSVGTDDDIGWYPIDNSSRDMEFQYLSDNNARTILSAYQMSPEELAGYAHLSRGTNSQSLSESNSEFKLEAARDTGIRPLLAQFQNFINHSLLPRLDEELAKCCSFKFVGLDAETAEKESVRIQTDMAVHMTMDEVLEKVEKKPLGTKWGGRFPLNPQWQAQLDKYVPVGFIMEYFFGMEGAAKDPRYQYVRDSFYFQQMQLLMSQQQMQAQQQAQEQQPQQQPQEQEQGQGPGEQQAQQQPQEGTPRAEESSQDEDLSRSIDQLEALLSKSEAQLPQGKRRLLAQQRGLVQNSLTVLERESKSLINEILDIADKSLSTKLK